MTQDWVADAACRKPGVDVAVFFPTLPWHENAARAICKTCIVKDACLTHALERGENDGIWGGLNPSERARMTRPPRICRGCGGEIGSDMSPQFRYCSADCQREQSNRRHRERRRKGAA